MTALNDPKSSSLLELAKARFGKLEVGEWWLVRGLFDIELGIRRNPELDFRVGKDEKDKSESEQNKPENYGSWGPKRTLRAEVLEWALTNKETKKHIGHKGVRIIGARITGELNLAYTTLPFLVKFARCSVAAQINLRGANIKELDLRGSHIPGMTCDQMKVEGSVLLSQGFISTGQMSLTGAVIGGQLACKDGSFTNRGGTALSIAQAEVRNGVFLSNGFTSFGEVNLLGAKIHGNLECDGGIFANPNLKALSADGLNVTGDVLLREGFLSMGEVRLLGATIGGELDCERGSFENHAGPALSADGMKVSGRIALTKGFHATGEVRLLGADIGGQLACVEGRFENPGKIALHCDGMTVGGDVLFSEKFHASGEVRLPGADIGGQLNCEGGRLENPSGDALSCDGAKVGGGVFLTDGFHALGQVRLLGAEIGGQLGCIGGRFENRNGNALNAQGIVVKGATFLAQQGMIGDGAVGILGKADFSNGKFEQTFKWAQEGEPLDALVAPGGAPIGPTHAIEVIRKITADPKDSWTSNGYVIAEGRKARRGESIRSKRFSEERVSLRKVLLDHAQITGGLIHSATERAGKLMEMPGAVLHASDPLRASSDSLGVLADALTAARAAVWEPIDTPKEKKEDLRTLSRVIYRLGGEVEQKQKALAEHFATLSARAHAVRFPSRAGMDREAARNAFADWIRGFTHHLRALSRAWREFVIALTYPELFLLEPRNTTLILRNAKIGTLCIGEKVGAELGGLELHGLVYEATARDMGPAGKNRTDALNWWKKFLGPRPKPGSAGGGVAGRAERDARGWRERLRSLFGVPRARTGTPPKREPSHPLQPYEQAAMVLRGEGHDELSKDILIALEELRDEQSEKPDHGWFWILAPPAVIVAVLALLHAFARGSSELPRADTHRMGWNFVVLLAMVMFAIAICALKLEPVHRLLRWLARHLFGYGHKVRKAIPYGIGLVLLAYAGAFLGYECGLIVPMNVETPMVNPVLDGKGGGESPCCGGETEPTDRDHKGKNVRWNAKTPRGYPEFSPLAFALETSIPFVSLGQREYWHVETVRTCGVALRWILHLFTLAGWAIATMLGAAFTGVLKK